MAKRKSRSRTRRSKRINHNIRKTVKRRTRRTARPTIILRSSEHTQYKPHTAPKITFSASPQPVSKQHTLTITNQKQRHNKIKPFTSTPIVETLQHRVCKRRSQRNEIIHALKKSGSGGQKQPNNLNRDVQC